ncbi:MAG TPA: serine/threonine protein kinase, partial [Phycisphaerales bacterium]|nr:serine/threonine protein kinase [Phycisphaerales bacterium]
MRETVDAGGGRGGRRPRSDRAMVMDALEQADRAAQAGEDDSGSRAGPVMPLPEGFFPGYELQREIHRGGQGVVYKAKQRSTGQMVAIKLMHGWSSTGDSARSRFEREVHVLAQLDHPGIVHVLDSGQTPDGGLYYVMDYVGGKPLDVIIREWRRRDERIRTSTSKSTSRTTALGATELRSRLELFAKVCEGVNAAHLKGVIHRDLKPANIRLDARGEPVVVDFGLAKVPGVDDERARAMTTTGQFIGSMPWSSPEQAEGAHG